jgi:RNA polymerase sigma-70 factor (ECF subfamily)
MQDAKQLLNDGFVKIFMNIHTFRGQGSFEGWMRKTMLNTCLDFVKQNYLRNSLTQPLSDHIIESKYDPTYEQALQKISFKELLNLIQLLPPITQTVFNLFVFEDYTHKEIAALLNMSEGTSYWHVHHARAVLQNKLKSIHAQNNIYERKSI